MRRRRRAEEERVASEESKGSFPQERASEIGRIRWSWSILLLVLTLLILYRDAWKRVDRLAKEEDRGDVPFYGSYRPSALASMRARNPTSPISAFAWNRIVGGVPRDVLFSSHDVKDEEQEVWFGDGNGYHAHVSKAFRLDSIVHPHGSGTERWRMRLRIQRHDPDVDVEGHESVGSESKEKLTRVAFYVVDESGGVAFPRASSDEVSDLVRDESDDEESEDLRGEVYAFGKTSEGKRWTINAYASEGVSRPSYWSTCHVASHNATESISRRLWRQAIEQDDQTQVPRLPNGTACKRPNMYALEWLGIPPFDVVVSWNEPQEFYGTKHTKRFASEKEPGLTEYEVARKEDPVICNTKKDAFDTKACYHRAKFVKRFRDLFHLQALPGIGSAEEHVAREAIGQLLSGIGYFHGRSIIAKSRNHARTREGPVSELFTAVPARKTFPRGFLWDEGFHQLLISRWHGPTSRLIMAHWLDLMDSDGWIPREQILGEEARQRVPPEFIVQYSTDANPPALLLAIEEVLDRVESGMLDRVEVHEWKSFLTRAWPKLLLWVEWYRKTQAGPLPGSFRWKGRDPNTNKELNPKTLMSGLDDYPRASQPDPEERHLDLFCWMAVSYRVIARLARFCEASPKDKLKTERLRNETSDLSLLERLHYSKELGFFSDFGKHTESIIDRDIQELSPSGSLETVRIYKAAIADPPIHRHIPHYGYVSLFPLMFKLLDPNSIEMKQQIEMLRSEDHLWTPFGLRSLSKASSIYQKHNTMHDPPYWRGAIWININYLVVKALEHYARIPGKNQALIAQTHHELREALVTNVVRQYTSEGFFYEHYNDITGKGQGARPFTGWTTLIVLIMESHV